MQLDILHQSKSSATDSTVKRTGHPYELPRHHWCARSRLYNLLWIEAIDKLARTSSYKAGMMNKTRHGLAVLPACAVRMAESLASGQ